MRYAPAVAILAARILLVLVIGRPWSPGWESRILYSDSHSYLRAAGDLSDGAQDEPQYRMPGYPLILLAAEDLLGGGWTGLLVLQQLADLATALVAARLASTVLGASSAGPAATLYMLLPPGIIYSAYLIPDAIGALLAACTGLIWMMTTAGGSLRASMVGGLASGCLLSAALLLKPAAVAGPAVYIVLCIAPGPSRTGRMVFAALLLLPFLAVHAGLRSHNMSTFGLPGLTTQDALEPLGRAVTITDYKGLGDDIAGFWQFADSLERQAVVEGRIDYSARDSIFRSATLEALGSNPLRAAWMELTRWPKFFLNRDGHIPYPGLPPSSGKPLWGLGPTSLPVLPLGI